MTKVYKLQMIPVQSSKSTIVKQARSRSCDKFAVDTESSKKAAANIESSKKSSEEWGEETAAVVESSVEVVMYVKGIEKAAMEDFFNTKDTLEKVLTLPAVIVWSALCIFSD